MLSADKTKLIVGLIFRQKGKIYLFAHKFGFIYIEPYMGEPPSSPPPPSRHFCSYFNLNSTNHSALLWILLDKTLPPADLEHARCSSFSTPELFHACASRITMTAEVEQRSTLVTGSLGRFRCQCVNANATNPHRKSLFKQGLNP